MWDDHWQENWFWEAGWGRNTKSAEWKQDVGRKKTEFKTKIIRGKTVKYGKRREEQNIWLKVKYNIKSSDLTCTNLKEKKWMLKAMQERKYKS